MNALVLLAEAGSGGQIGQIASTFGVDWPHLIAQIISFSIVCAILYMYAYGPILAMLEQRREQIAQGIANAEKIKAELDKTEGPAPRSDGSGSHSRRQIHRGSPVCGGPPPARGKQ
jgi:F-type H+-transporting ATPase subunit b